MARGTVRLNQWWTLALALAASVPTVASAQAVGDTLAAARTLRDTRQFGAAIALLRPFVLAHPDHGEALRTLAQTLYWNGMRRDAAEWYELGLVRHPADTAVRLAYATMLVETGSARRARELLAPLRNVASLRGRPEALLGTIALWDGDLATARTLLRASLGADDTQQDVQRHLGDIAALTAPRLSATFDARDDDQPLTRIRGELVGGWYLSPSTSLGLRGGRQQFTSGDSVSHAVTHAEGSVTTRFAASRMDAMIAGGQAWRADGITSEWIGRAGLGVRVVPHLTLRATAARDLYLYTLASIGESVVATTYGATLSLDDARGWLGEARVQTERFPDTNQVATAYAWLLAPLVNRNGTAVHVGYSIAIQDADFTRFVPDASGVGTGLGGHYEPYYTPRNLLVHSALASVRVKPSPRTTFGLRGSVGFAAHDDAPFVILVGGFPGALLIDFARRSFTPYDASAEFGAALSGRTRVNLTARSQRTVFYTVTTVGFRIDQTLGRRGSGVGASR